MKLAGWRFVLYVHFYEGLNGYVEFLLYLFLFLSLTFGALIFSEGRGLMGYHIEGE